MLATLQELVEKNELHEAATVSVALQAVYNQILLTLMDAKIRTDVHTFINVALIWAMSELELFDHEQYSKIGLTIVGLPEDFMFCNFTRTFLLPSRALLSLFPFNLPGRESRILTLPQGKIFWTLYRMAEYGRFC